MLPRFSPRPAVAAAVLAAVCSTLAFGTPLANAETWAERLGFPAGSRVVVLHANELGMSYETNAAGTRLLKSGLVSSASAMAPAPWFGDLAEWAKANPNADVGLELTLNSEFPTYRWQPVASDGLVPSLADPAGFLWRTPIQTMVNATPEDVERELRAQIQRAKEAGLQPSHFTTHLGTLVTRPDLIEVYLRIARQEWIPAMVVELRFVADAESYEAKKQAFLKTLRELQPGITQIAFHPAVESDALKRITPDWQQRVWDAQLLADPDVKQALESSGIIITNWRELMKRFEGTP